MKIIVISLFFIGTCLGMQPQGIQLRKTTNRYCPDTHALYAFKNEKNIGYITWASNGILELKVDQNYRNKGVGGYLFCTALKQIKDENYDHAYWYAVDSILFYRRFGAQVIDTEDTSTDHASMHFNFHHHGDPVANYARYKSHKNNLPRNTYDT